MQAGRKRRRRLRARSITADNVLIIVNSDVPLSAAIADYYQAARNLTNHRLTFALGTGLTASLSGAAFYAGVVVPVHAYMQAHDIKCVLCSAGMPILVNMDTSGVLVVTAVFGDSTYFVERLGSLPGNAGGTSSLHNEDITQLQAPYIRASETYGASTIHRVKFNGDYRLYDRVPWIPYGRIGLPAVDGAPAETEAETRRMIDDAIANELTFQETVTRDCVIHVGLHDRAIGEITGLDFEQARRRLVAAGVSTQHYKYSYTADWHLQPPPVSYDRADLLAGSLSLDAWGLIGSAIMNEAIGAPYISSFNLQPGAWGFEATSAGKNLMANILMNGGCAAAGTIYEPFTYGVIKGDLLVLRLMHGATLAEASSFNYRRAGWAMDVWGDPLYRPFGRQFAYHH